MARILIVEDNESLRLAYQSFLEEAGYEVAVAPRVQEALDYLATTTPDVILLDMFMPAESGMELLQKYDVRNEHKTVKVIVFSNLADMRLEQQALSLGAIQYLTKASTTPQQLIEKLKGILAAV